MRTEYSIKNSITSFISNIISFVFLFIGQTFFIKILGLEYNGLNGLFSNILTFLNLFELGIGSAIVYNLYKYVKENDKETIKSLIKFYKKAYNIIALSIFVIGLLIIPFLKLIIKEVNIDINIYFVYILFLISTVCTYLITYKRNLIFVNQRNYVINIIHIIYIIVLNVFQILIIYLTKNYYLYLIVKIICILLENIIINIKANKDYPYILEKDVKKLDDNIKNDIVNRVKALFIHKTSGAITNGTDNILLSSFFGLKSVGLYTNYYYIIHTISTLFSGVIMSSNASVGNLLVEKNYDKNYETFKKIKFLNFWIATFTSICLLLLIEPFITLWLGSLFLLDKITLFSLILNFFQGMMRNTFKVFKESAGIWKEDWYVPIIQSTLNIVFSIIMLKLIGIAGIFIGTIISSLVLWFYSYPKFVYKPLFNKGIKKYSHEFISDLIVFITIVVITYIINLYSLNIIISFLICLIVPNFLLLLIYYKTDEFKYYINLLKKYLKRLNK